MLHIVPRTMEMEIFTFARKRTMETYLIPINSNIVNSEYHISHSQCFSNDEYYPDNTISFLKNVIMHVNRAKKEIYSQHLVNFQYEISVAFVAYKSANFLRLLNLKNHKKPCAAGEIKDRWRESSCQVSSLYQPARQVTILRRPINSNVPSASSFLKLHDDRANSSSSEISTAICPTSLTEIPSLTIELQTARLVSIHF